MRNKLGRFVHGHKVLPDRDPVSGRFVSKTMESLEEKVDRILREKGNSIDTSNDMGGFF